MVYGFIRQSGGSVKIKSELGEGTTVRILLPASQKAETADPGGSNRSSDRGGTESILVVDDRPDVAQLARIMLEDAGYKVETAENGQQAIDIMDSGKHFSMLFSDLIMPGGMNGVSLARTLKQRFPKLKVLLTTGYAEAELERTDAGGTEFDVISKPYTKTDLIRKIRIVMDGPTGVG